MAQIDPQLATVYSIAGMTKISFVSGHVSGALMAHFATITKWCESLPTSTSYRTGAVSPDLAVILSLCGFTVANELVLLEIDPHETIPSEGSGDYAPSDPDWSVSSRRSRAAARVDTAAFPPGWSLTSEEILLAARSTGTAGLALVRNGLRNIGYALVGASENVAYLQRLAVHPSRQGMGLGTALTTQSLRWAQRAGAVKMFVNTETDNSPALALYRRLGFRVCSEGLVVMERSALST